MWSWKSNTGTDVSGATDTWTVYAGPVMINNTVQQNGPLLENRANMISRVLPRAVFGQLLDYTYNSADHSFVLHAHADKAPGVTEIYIPSRVSGDLTVSGNAGISSLTPNPDGSRTALITVHAAGDYSIGINSSDLKPRVAGLPIWPSLFLLLRNSRNTLLQRLPRRSS